MERQTSILDRQDKPEKVKDKILSCGHMNTINLSHKFGNGLLGPAKKVDNFICVTCGMHHYKGRDWTKAEWEEYVEDFSHDPESYHNKK